MSVVVAKAISILLLRSKTWGPRRHKKARRFLPSAAPTIPTGGKGYSTTESIDDLFVGGNVRYRTEFLSKTTKRCQKSLMELTMISEYTQTSQIRFRVLRFNFS